MFVPHFFNSVFRHSAECILGYRCGQFGQRTGTHQGTLQSSFLNIKVFSIWVLTLFFCCFRVLPNLCLCRMNKRKRRLPVRSLHCRKPRRWLKSAPCLLPTSPLQREFLSLLLLHSCFYIHFRNVSHQAGIVIVDNFHSSLKALCHLYGYSPYYTKHTPRCCLSLEPHYL